MQKPDLNWRDGDVPLSTRFDDPYYSLDDGLGEARHVFLAGNGLPERFRDGFHIAELGFGTGLNLVAARQAWDGAGCAGRFHFTSFEAYPMPRAAMARALAAFEGIGALAAELTGAYPLDGGEFDFGPARVNLILGDARDTLARWDGRADAWFLDGFSPARNPQMWSPELMAEVGRHTAEGGSFATYTAAGHVRRALSAAGFAITKARGFGRKRDMCRGVRP